MGRKSALTDKQWEQIEKRLLQGEKAAALAAEFGINRSQITRRFSQHIATVKTVANQIVAAEEALHSLPVAQQLNAISHADQLRAIRGNLTSAAGYGAATANRLLGMAHTISKRINLEALDDIDIEELKKVAAFTRTANESSDLCVNLMKIHKDAVEELDKRDAPKENTHHTLEFIKPKP